MLGRADVPDDTVGGDDLDRTQGVAAQAERALQRAHAAAEGEPGDAGLGDLAAGHHQTVPLGGGVDVGPPGARADPGGARPGIDGHGRHVRQVDDQAVLAHRAPGDLVAAAPDAHGWSVGAGHGDGGHDVGSGRAAGDHDRASVDESVPHPAGLLVAVVGAVDDVAGQGGAQVGDEGLVVDGDGHGVLLSARGVGPGGPTPGTLLRSAGTPLARR